MYAYGVQRVGFMQIPARADLAFDFLPVEWRHVHHYGVELGGLRYNSPALDAYRQVTSPYGARTGGNGPSGSTAADVSRVWFQDPNDHRWHAVSWEHAGAVGAPFSEDALTFAKQLASQRDRFPDVRRTLRDLLERWGAGLAHGPSGGRRCAWPKSEPASSAQEAGARRRGGGVGVVRELFPKTVVPDGRGAEHAERARTAEACGDDDDGSELDDDGEDDFYADAMGLVE